VILNFT